MFDFTGRSAVVTGAASGIGRATAEYLARCGAAVLVADVDSDGATEAAGAINDGGGQAMAFEYDAAVAHSARDTVRACVDWQTRLDFVVAAAGVHETVELAALDEDRWRRTMSVNLDAVFHLAREAITAMADGGAIVNVASTAGHKGGTVGHAHYGAAKGGVLALTRGLARELWPRIRVNAVSPGLVDTPMMSHHIHDAESARPLKDPSEYARPDQIASVIAFLCSNAASFVAGETIIVAGTAFMA